MAYSRQNKNITGHSTNTQTQSVPIPPWRSGGEPPLASIRPMSAQLRTVAVLPTSQSPSAVMVPPQQQVIMVKKSNNKDRTVYMLAGSHDRIQYHRGVIQQPHQFPYRLRSRYEFR